MSEHSEKSRADAGRRIARLTWWGEHDRDSYECPDCGRDESAVFRFDVHHKDGDPTHNDLSNLIALCVRCHRARHGATTFSPTLEEWKAGFLNLDDEDYLSPHPLYRGDEQ